MGEVYKGKIVPELNGLNMALDCDNSMCYGIPCMECINYPTGIVADIKHEYLMKRNKDEYISEGLERLPDGD